MAPNVTHAVSVLRELQEADGDGDTVGDGGRRWGGGGGRRRHLWVGGAAGGRFGNRRLFLDGRGEGEEERAAKANGKRQ